MYEYAIKWLEVGHYYLGLELGSNIYDSNIQPKLLELVQAIELLKKAGEK